MILGLVAACGYPRPTLSGGDAPADAARLDAKDLSAVRFVRAANPGLARDVDARPTTETVFDADLPIGSIATGLVATFATDGTEVTVDGVVQESGVTANDFTSPRGYVVTASDGSQRVYTIKAHVLDYPTPATMFSAAGVTGVGLADLDGTLAVIAPGTNGNVYLDTTVAGATVPTLSAAIPFGATNHAGVAAGDLDGDGHTDLAVTDTSTVTIFKGPQPSFVAGSPISVGSSNVAVAIADFDRDGRPDLVIMSGAAVEILLNTTPAPPNNTAATFAPPAPFALTGTPFALSIADFDGDGKPDVVVGDLTGNAMVLLDRSTPGTVSFAPRADFPIGSDASTTVADLNGDGKPDLIAANFSPATISVRLNTTEVGATAASFSAIATFPTGKQPWSTTTGDLDGDGRPDIITPNTMPSSVSVLLNTTPPGAMTPTFTAHRELSFGGGLQWAAVGDIDHDGNPDLVVATPTQLSILVMR